MNNRVEYLSDRLVNLRGKHKSVDEVIPPDSIANGVSVTTPLASRSADKNNISSAAEQAMTKRREQTSQLGSDLEQRILKRQKQLSLQIETLSSQTARLHDLSRQMKDYREALKNAQVNGEEILTASELGERYRAIDKLRLDFFDADAEVEMLLNNHSAVSVSDQNADKIPPENFKTMLKKGLAWALTAGMVIAAAILLAAAILFSAWN